MVRLPLAPIVRFQKPWKIAFLAATIVSFCAFPIYAAMRLVICAVSLVPPVPASTGEWTGLVKVAVGCVCALVGLGPTFALVIACVCAAFFVCEWLVGGDF